MAYQEDLRIATLEAILKEHCTAVLSAIDAAYDQYLKITDAQNGQTVLAWSRTLHNLADTENATLTVSATSKTVSCLAGANLFANFRVGRDVQFTNFTNAGNNQTVEVKTVAGDGDSITLVDSSSGWVNETDTNARAQENATADEQAKVTAIVNTIAEFSDLKNALDNAAVAQQDRRAIFQDWVW